jgi:hypothetical protein
MHSDKIFCFRWGMNGTSFALLLLMVFPQVLFSEQIDSGNTEPDTVRVPGNAFDAYIVNQTALGYRWFVSDHRAISISGDLSASASSTTQDASGSNTTQDQTNTALDVSVYAQMQWFFLMARPQVSAFVAAGPVLRYSRTHTRTESSNPSMPQSQYTGTIDTYSFDSGIILTGGIELLITRLVSVLARYDISATIGRESRRSDYPAGIREDKYTNWDISVSQVRLGLGIHF